MGRNMGGLGLGVLWARHENYGFVYDDDLEDHVY